MTPQAYEIDGIPALLWGAGRGTLYIAVHGDQSHKADDAIRVFAQTAVQAGHRVLSFDLPEHGDRKTESARCTPPVCARDLQAVLTHARTLADKVGLFACSLGAYFSLLAYPEAVFTQALFLSPVVDMQRLLGGMMAAFGVTEDQLRASKEVPTPVKTLSWDYYAYVKDHPVGAWATSTAILMGEGDTVSDLEAVRAFAERNGAGLMVVPAGEHFFHTPEQLAILADWAAGRLGCRGE